MKALSIRQPWAWLIVRGEKPIENRAWKTNYSGPLCIHAALSFDEAGYRWVKRNFRSIRMPTPKRFVLGAIVGVVDMVGYIIPSGAFHSPWFTGPYGFEFGSPKEFETPIPFRGQLGFFDVPDELVNGHGTNK
jgi:hypothetical protein